MSQPLKDATAAFFGLTHAEQRAVEALKDDAHTLLLGNIYRKVQISLSEDWAKIIFGKDIFGQLAIKRLWQCASNVVCCSDSGFAEEAWPLVKSIGAQNVLLVRIHRDGCTFDGDSRTYIDLPGVTTLDIRNHHSLTEYQRAIDAMVQAWLSP
jgi:hypothetical protein